MYDEDELAVRAGGADRTRAPSDPAEAAEQDRSEEHPDVKKSDRAQAAGSGGPPIPAKPKRDETLQHPRSVFQVLKRHFARYTPEMVVRGLRHRAGGVRAGRAAGSRRTATATGRRRGCTRWAGRSTASARSTSAPARSCRPCWATSAAPAAGSWRCAGTPASRAPPTSRRCSTCCPATCRCRTRCSTRRWTSTCADAAGKAGFWGNKRVLHGQPAQGLVGRRRDGRRTTSASTTCPRSTATTAPTGRSPT